MFNVRQEQKARQLAAVVVLSFITSFVFGVVTSQAALAKTYNQSGYALARYSPAEFKAVKNKNYGKKVISSYHGYPRDETKPHVLKKAKGNKAVTFTTWAYLPKSYRGPGDMGNPQSINVSPDGQYAWVTYPAQGKKNYGYIVRYDLFALNKLNISKPGETMNLLHGAAHKSYTGKTLTADEQAAIRCMTFGPTFKMGHGACFAYNPKDGCLWFCSKTGQKKTDLQRINMNTLKPDLCINYKMYGTVAMGNNLTFDKQGHCYFHSYSGGGWTNAPKGTIKIYQGTINLNAKKKIKWKLMMQGIRYSLSNNIQSMGYNAKSNRLYLVSNSTVMSVPVAKLVKGKLTKGDIHSTIFTDAREYEGIAFDNTGRSYLLVNKQPEILCANAGF